MASAFIVIVVSLPLLAAAMTPYLAPFLKGRVGWWAAGSALVSLLLVASFAPAVARGEQLALGVEWVPALGINVSFLVDGLGLLFASIITGVGVLIFVYSQCYLEHDENHVRFYALMLLFMGAMLGTVLSANLMFLFVFWELTSLSSFFLIGFKSDREENRLAALQALMVTALGGLAMLAGFILLYGVTGTFELAQLWERREEITSSPLYLPILVLVLAGAFSKSALFPFHFWLPNAMVAPTPVSAYLHSAAMVKAGIYLIARFYPILGGTQEWLYLVGGVGMVTMLLGSYLAIRQVELKAMMAYSTVSQLGLIAAGYGFGGELGVLAATFQTLNHAVFKAALFMVVGIVDHAASTRHFNRLGGLAERMPATAAVAALGVLSLAGVPPLNGFLSKELVFEALINQGPTAWIYQGPTGLMDQGPTALLNQGTTLWFVPLLMALGAVLTVIYSLRFFIGAFLGPAGDPYRDLHEVSPRFLFPPAVLAAICVVIGVAPAIASGWLLAPAVASIARHPVEVDIHLWNGVGLPVLMSAGAIAIGAVAYWRIRRLLALEAREAAAFSFERLYEACISFLNYGTPQIFERLQSGYLRRYVMVVASVPVALAGLALWAKGGVGLPRVDLAAVQAYDYGIVVFFLLATLATAAQRDRLGAILALGAVGSLVSLTYVLYSAPDLALTQLLIEILSVVLFALVFVYMLPFSRPQIVRAGLARDAAIGTAVGVMVMALMLAITSSPIYASIRDYYVQASSPLAGGDNLVNVIIVDFRGYDTMGEIVVLAISAIALFALVKLGRGRKTT
ncbi:MAG: DUF4040 domain-containing protein [Chloroflexi bacterium]|nr:DUF4040 domain-containing protein [Chloroflexota bacterium]